MSGWRRGTRGQGGSGKPVVVKSWLWSGGALYVDVKVSAAPSLLYHQCFFAYLLPLLSTSTYFDLLCCNCGWIGRNCYDSSSISFSSIGCQPFYHFSNANVVRSSCDGDLSLFPLSRSLYAAGRSSLCLPPAYSTPRSPLPPCLRWPTIESNIRMRHGP